MSGANKWTPLGPDCIIDGQMDEGGGRAPVSGRVTSIVLDGGNVYVGTAGGGVWVSDDLGVNWTPLDDKQASLAVGAMVLDPVAKRLYIGTGEGNSGGRMQHGQGLLIYDTQNKVFKPRITAIPSPVVGDPTVITRYKKLRTSAMLLEPATPGNPQRLWMGTTNGLFYSIDDGQHWLTSSLNGAANQIVSSLALAQDAGGQQVLAAWWGTSNSYDNGAGGTVTVRYNGGVFRKKADQTFDALPKATEPSNKLTDAVVGRTSMAVAPSNAQRVYVLMASNGTDDFHGLYRSEDGGQTWSKRQLPGDSSRKLKQSNYNLTLAVHPTAPDTLIVGEKALWRSTDGGDNWQCISAPHGDSPGTHSDQHVVVYDPAHPDRVWLGNDGGVWLSEDGGTTWKHRNRGLNTLQYYAMVHHAGAESVLLAGAQDNGTQRFAGHAGWNLVGYGDGFFCGIDAQDPRYWYSSYCYRNGSGDLSGIKRSDVAGAITSWSDVTDGMDGSEYASQKDEPFYIPFILDPVTSSTLYLGTTRLWRSHNRGTSWHAVAKANGTVFTTATSVLPKKPTQHEGISAICVDPNDPTIIYVGARDGRIFQVVLKTFDAHGKVTDASWSAATSPANPPALDVVADGDPGQFLRSYCTDLAVPKLNGPAPLPNRPVYVAYGSDYLSWNLPQHICQARVWKVDFTNVATPAWTPLGTNGLEGKFPEPPHLIHQQNFANALAIDPQDPLHIFVGCHVGVYESKDGGTSWHPFLDGLPNVPVVDLQFHPTKRLLRAATMGRSVWERPVEDIAVPNQTDADVFIRDNIVDLGRYATHATADDPLNPPNQVKWLDGVDIKVDSKSLLGNLETPLSTQDYSGSGPIDYIAFQQLEHETFVRRRQSRIYVQMSNRGPKKATGVVVRLYWARMTGDTIPPLPASFWAGYPDANPGPADAWQAVAPKGTLTDLPAGSPRVLHFDFSPPDESVDLALMAVMSSAEDPVNGSGTDVAAIAQANKRVVVRRVPVGYSTAEIVITILAVAGLVAGFTAAAVAAS